MTKFLRGFNFVYWVFMVIVSVAYVVIDMPIDPIHVMLMAFCGLLEHINGETWC